MQQRDDDVYVSTPLRRLRVAQERALTPQLQRCFGVHGLLLSACPDDEPPVSPSLGNWVRLHLGGRFYRGDLQAAADEPLPFVDDAFELVLMRHAMEVSPAASALLAEAIRVLAPGGALILAGVHPISIWSPWLRWRGRGRSLNLRTPLQLRQTLRRAGMEVELVRRVGRSWPWLVRAGGNPTNPCGGGYVLLARKRRRMVTPLRVKPAHRGLPANGQLSPGTRRSSAC